MNDENDLDHNVEDDAIENPASSITNDKVVQALNEMKTKKPLDLQMYHWS